MRIAVLIVGIVGSLAAGTLGALWLLDRYSPAGLMMDAMRQELRSMGPNGLEEAMRNNLISLDSASLDFKRWDRHVLAIWFLLGAVPLGIGGALLGLGGRGFCGAILMFLAVLGPAVLDWHSLAFTFLLIIAEILCLFVKRPRPILEN